MKYKTIQILSTILIKLIYRKQKKIWLSIGDSLTKPLAYQFLSKKSNGFFVINNSVGGSSVADYGGDSLCLRVKKIELKQVDLITILCGTNDFSFGTKMGELGNFNEKEFIGALESVMQTLIEKYPKAEITLLSSPERTTNKGEIANELGYTMKDYSNAIQSVANEYNINYVDVCNNSGITVSNLDRFTLDGVHLNWKGHKEIAKLLDS